MHFGNQIYTQLYTQILLELAPLHPFFFFGEHLTLSASHLGREGSEHLIFVLARLRQWIIPHNGRAIERTDMMPRNVTGGEYIT